MSVAPITSRQHPFVQRCRQLLAGRGEQGDILLDGLHLVRDALDAGVPISGALVDDRGAELTGALRARQVPIHVASRTVLDAASPVRTPTGVVAIARWAPSPTLPLLDAPNAILVGLVGVQDPGNVGTIIRSADAIGATGVVVLDDTADPAGWKALRAAMGSTFRLPVAVGSTDDVLGLARARGIRIVATVATGGVAPDANTLAAPILVLIGSEGAGLPAALTSAADTAVSLPMRAGVNSLNAATTATIVIWELTRSQRERRGGTS